MKRLKVDLAGGMPLELDDFAWMQDATKEVFDVLLANISNGTPFKIKGCVPTISTGGGGLQLDSMTEGWIYMDGEVLYVPAVTTPIIIGSNFAYFEKDYMYDPAGLETFESSVNNDTYEIAIAVVEVDTSLPSGALNIFSDQTIYTNLADRLQAQKFEFSESIALSRTTQSLSGVSFALNNNVNFIQLDFTTPNLELKGITGYANKFLFVQFNGTGGATECRVYHNDATVSASTRIIMPQSVDRIVKTGQTCLLIHDGTNWKWVSGGVNVDATLGVDLTVGVGYVEQIDIKAYKSSEGFVKVAGAVSNSIGFAINDVIATLPIGYRPKQISVYSCGSISGITGGATRIIVQTNGEIVLASSTHTTGTAITVYLDGINFVV